jgi:hypothetical protein
VVVWVALERIDFMKIENVQVYGLDESIRRAKFPMSVDTSSLNDELTKGVANLAKSKSGEGHDQWLTGVVVQFDVTGTLKWWTEAQRYHFLDFVSSQSTMHRICKFDIEEQCNEYVHIGTISVLRGLVDCYNDNPTPENYLRVLYNIPTGFQLTAGMTTNYRQLKTIYKQRKNHRLQEWRDFCKWIESLPHSELIVSGAGGE